MEQEVAGGVGVKEISDEEQGRRGQERSHADLTRELPSAQGWTSSLSHVTRSNPSTSAHKASV